MPELQGNKGKNNRMNMAEEPPLDENEEAKGGYEGGDALMADH